ncbi:hypothetical protein NKH84_23040 [Mesorhizobium sp. M0902]|uniref:hypothetical protein n=1 Tax=unclassified Mesorhizobium TaxID=325217 RepID=UPI003336B9F0
MTEFKIIPFTGAGEIEFGMSPNQIRRRLGTNFRTFKRSIRDTFPCDYFENIGVFCYYSKSGKLNAVEFTSPAAPSLNGVRFLGTGFEIAKRALISLGQEIEEEIDGAIALSLGVSIYAPLAKEDSMAPVETVLIFQKGYYQ